MSLFRIVPRQLTLLAHWASCTDVIRGAAGPITWIHSFALVPGAQLQIASEHPSNISVKSHTSPHVLVEAPQWKVRGTDSGRSIEATGSPDACHATIPDRWCGLWVSTRGGQVSIDRVVEAPLNVSTGGGSLILGTIRATNAVVSTNHSSSASGRLHATELTATEIHVRGGNGAMHIGRCLAQNLLIEQGPGDVEVKSLFVGKARINTEGGPVTLKVANASEVLTVHTAGGRIVIDDCDGKAVLESGGAPVKVHVSASGRHLSVNSGGGDVALSVSPLLAATLTVTAGGGVRLESGFAFDGDLSATSARGVLRATSAPQRGSRATGADTAGSLGEALVCSLEVEAGKGAVTLSTKDWFHSFQHAKGPAALANHERR